MKSLRQAFLLLALPCVAVLAIAGSSSCEITAPDSVICANGRICPPGLACTSAGDACISDGCGNGILDVGEGCDDGNANLGDDCPQCQPAFCGDRYIWEGVEACDDPDATGIDGDCRADCLDFIGCGNGLIDAGEECDDGNGNNGDECPDDPDASTPGSCKLATCGDGYLWLNVEICDPGLQPDGCTHECRSDGTCGNGIVDPGEECDDGNQNNSDDCPDHDEDPNDDLPACKLATCGDGHVHAILEACDPSSPEYMPPNLDECRTDCLAVKGCGNGFIEKGEECDDGNQNNNDECPDGEPNPDHPTCLFARCGDSYMWEGREECDDGNTVDEDACPSGAIGTCQNPFCGDNITNNSEECDDGNDNNNDRCLEECKLNVCGDGHVYVGKEQCDDGNQLNDKDCDRDCSFPKCRDDVHNPLAGEECDVENNDVKGCGTDISCRGLDTSNPCTCESL